MTNTSELVKGNFGQALDSLKEGFKVCREGWNGKGMWLKLINNWNGKIGNMPTDYELLPWIGMKTADNKFVPWLASQTDLLAEDWITVISTDSTSPLPYPQIIGLLQ